jgi:hypothetical protein
MIRRVMKAAFAPLAAALLCAIPAPAAAHGGNNDPDAVHACVGNFSKIVRAVGVGGACIAGPPIWAETPLHWTLKGKEGPKGLDGKDGKDGAPGADGASVSFVTYFTGSAEGCSNGGAILAVGDPPTYVYVCNGTDGTIGEGGGAARADGPCFGDGNFPRYADCGNGTVTDTVTGLIWLKMWAVADEGRVDPDDGPCRGARLSSGDVCQRRGSRVDERRRH